MKKITFLLIFWLFCSVAWGQINTGSIGVITPKLATDAETVTGTATNVATTPANITARLANPGTIGTTPGPGNFTNITANATLGTELITWTAAGWDEGGVEWTVAGTPIVITHATGNTTALTSTLASAITAGVTYKVVITYAQVAGTCSYTLGGVTGSSIATSATSTSITDYITASTTVQMIITPLTTSNIVISSISIKALTDATGDLTVDGNLTVRSPAVFLGQQVRVPEGSVQAGSSPGLTFSLYTDTGLSANGSNFCFWESGIIALNLADVIKEFRVPSDYKFSFSSATDNNSGSDTLFLRDAANTPAFRNSTNQQKVNIYNTAASATADYERLALTGVQTASLNLTAETNGTGADNLDIVLTPAGTGKVSSPAEIVGTNYKTIYIPASACTSTATNGALLATNEYATNDINMDYYAFDGATEQYIEFQIPMPEDWNRGTIKAKVFWSSATDSTAGDTCEWEILGGALSNDDAIDAALGTAQVISDVLLADNGTDMQLSNATPAITVGGTPALADMVHFKISRNVGGTDDMTENAWLYGIWVQYLANTSVATW